ncbi:MAG TPA: hypothetical protein VKA21_03950 [Candidatus Binatia bacterium]|nr:hypothetical protein [Candidatus Binatia bacterium]
MSGRRLLAAALVAAALGCAPRERKWRWTGDRKDLIRASQVWIGGDPAEWRARMRTLDLLAGPDGGGRFGREETVRCDYVEPKGEDEFHGNTPKFLCAPAGGAPVKVKWGADNGEIYGEVAGTRLLWALGFPADAVYPVTVDCTGCADDPWSDPKPRPGHRPPPFTPAIVERKFPGVTVQEEPHQGWRWDEIDGIDSGRGGAPRAHVDALKLLAAFIQHRDSKPDNQRLVCRPAGVGEGQRKTCTAPVMMIQDLGSAFGGPSWTATEKMNLRAWSHELVWRDARRCIANLGREWDARGGLRDPEIGEDGRRFLGELLAALTTDQIRALFTAARAERRGDIESWVAVFVHKRTQVLHPLPDAPDFRCPR